MAREPHDRGRGRDERDRTWPFFSSTRTQWSFCTRPSPVMRSVDTLQSRLPPSSCDEDVRSCNGQSGHGVDDARSSGGLGMISKYTIVFFGVSMVVYLLTSARDRRWLATPWPYLSAVIAQRARDEGGAPPIAFQLLWYPATLWDSTLPSFRENADAPVLDSAAVAAFSRAAQRVRQTRSDRPEAFYSCKMLLGECLALAIG